MTGMRHILTWSTVAIVAAGVLVGCSASDKQPANENAPVILYHRTGGFAGFDDRMVVWPDGFTHVSGRGYCMTGPADASDLDSEFRGWEALQPRYDAGGADRIRVTIVYRGRSVSATESADVPETFARARRALERIMNQVKSRQGEANVVPVPG